MKSDRLNPQSLRDSPLLRGVTLLPPPSPGGLSQASCLLLYGSRRYFGITLKNSRIICRAHCTADISGLITETTESQDGKNLSSNKI